MTLRIDNALFGKLFALIAGGLLPLAFAPFDYYFIAIFCLAFLFYFCASVTAKEAFFRGYLFGFACFGIGVNWLHISINLFGGVNLAGALIFTYLLVAFLSLYPALCVWLAVRFFKPNTLFVLPFLWVLTEWLRGWLLSGFPWLNIGTSQTDSLLGSYAPLTGVYGISLLVSIVAACLVFLFRGSIRMRMLAITCIIIIYAGAAYIKPLNWTKPLEEKLDVALIQGAIPQKIKWDRQQRQPTLEIYSELSKPYWSGDLIIWPETAIPSLYHSANDFLTRISADKENSDVLFMSGIAYKDPKSGDYFNSILLMDDTHRFYHKHQLVPFGEYLPFKAVLGNLLRFLKIPMSDFSSGDARMKTLDTNKGVLGMSICYEDAYSTAIRLAIPAANILINVSNDAWFGNSLAPHQHLQIARMRAMENGRYLLRSTNTGISAIIDAKGRLIARSPQFEPHALSGQVRLYEGSTPYSRFGNSPVIGLILGILLLSFAVRFRQQSTHP